MLVVVTAVDSAVVCHELGFSVTGGRRWCVAEDFQPTTNHNISHWHLRIRYHAANTLHKRSINTKLNAKRSTIIPFY